MAFIQDPRLRQTWNNLSHTTEAAASDAAAGIWAFGHAYVAPCLSAVSGAIDRCCLSVCLGADREERARRARERDRGARRIEASFDFYDDWDEDLWAAAQYDDYYYDNYYDDGGLGGSGSGGGSGRRGFDWERLLAGTGSRVVGRRGGGGDGDGRGVVGDQPRRKRGMSYGTRGGGDAGRRKVTGEEDDPNVIPRTAPLGFLLRLPFKIVGSLRYKPSAANLREHPGHGAYYGENRPGEEREPLLGRNEDVQYGRRSPVQRQQEESKQQQQQSPGRARSNTTMSGDTSSSYRSRNDLFSSDGEGDEDAVPLDDEFTVALARVSCPGGDDRSSNKMRSSKGKGKRPDGERGLSRTYSRTTMASSVKTTSSRRSTADEASLKDLGQSIYSTRSLGLDGEYEYHDEVVRSLENLRREEEDVEREENEEIERKRRAAERLAMQKGLAVNVAAGHTGTEQQQQQQQQQQDSEQREAHSRDQETRPKPNGSVTEHLIEESKPVPPTSPEAPLPKDDDDKKPGNGESRFNAARLPRFG
ncbi:uncharacterized protein CTHT_0066260 [Thermochaetoides thermophila DSM 1495]|uniref:Uncharacterized protein n=1 Tax=Chaetomium thermophilum (strain DSM 1495 / CBS 144.50 / IMI 039719) TaxID=759272 RepID=G0SGG6_CHATD|nr:hypothetical protein CTHT_0066260 [Thermochaetoides thermophila DSM 1495]EGS17305.1 hypothetical protein CTHT_0066260 [Thermochaetoides thermophila DSM 1495]